MNKKITFNTEARQELRKGVDALADVVRVTMGGRGRNVIYQTSEGEFKITKDGVTLARQVQISEPLQNMGAQMVRKAAQRTNEQAGDGTTTASVLAQSIYNTGLKYLEHGANPVELNRGIQEGVKDAVDYIGKFRKEATPELLSQVAMVSSNHDSEVATNVIKAFDMVGSEGEVSVEEAKLIDTEIEERNGFKINKGYTSEQFINDHNKGQAFLQNPLILISDITVMYAKHVAKFLDKLERKGWVKNRPIVFICGLMGEAEQFLAHYVSNGEIMATTVTPPASGDYEDRMQDIAAATGGVYVSHLSGKDLTQIDLEELGSAEQVVVERDQTTIIGGGGDVGDRIAMIESQRKEGSRYYEAMTQRIQNLRGKAAVIRVGGLSEVEIKEKKDRYEDAINAVKAARTEGVLPGGGVALYNASNWIMRAFDEKDRLLGYELLKESLRAPISQIAINAGRSSQWVIDTLTKGETTMGYNASTDKIEDMLGAGIVDPHKVVRVALQNAASVAGMLLTTEATIVFDYPKLK